MLMVTTNGPFGTYKSMVELDRDYVKMKILVTSVTLEPWGCESIKGRLRVQITKPSVLFQSMNVQLLGYFTCGDQFVLDEPPICSLYSNSYPNVELTVDIRPGRGGRFLPGPEDKPYISHIMKCSDAKTQRTLPRGTYYFPFHIELDKTPFPPSLDKPDAKVVYKVVAHFKISGVETLAAEKPVRLLGHLQLNYPPLHNNVTKGSPESGKLALFKRTRVGASLILQKLDFVRGENLDFHLVVDNPHGEMVSALSVSLVQKMTSFRLGATYKTTVEMLTDSHRDVGTMGISWSGHMEIPKDVMPTCQIHEEQSGLIVERRKGLEIKYYVHFLASVEGGGSIRGERKITIGTVWANLPSDYFEPLTPYRLQECSRRLQMSQSRRRSTWSLSSVMSGPPSYSTLSSRQPSMESLETLPPSYDEALAERL